MDKPVRVRFAPSPTGPLHIGGVRTALYNYLFAKKHKGTFLLRLEDTDQTRFVPGAEDYIVEALAWCGIEIDEGIGASAQAKHAPYRQSERKPMYRQYADQLLESGHAYIAFDTSEELEAMRERLKAAGVPSPQYNAITRSTMNNSLSLSAEEVQRRLDAGDPYVIRIKMPRNHEVRFKDSIRGWVLVNTNNMDDKVLFKSDGMPTYHLANVVDDHLMEVTHVIRGEEWLPSAPLHVLLYEFLGWEMPEFAHLPLILKPDGNGKLSKRDGDRLGFPVFPLDWKNPETGEVSSGYRESGYFPEAVLNILSLLGWNPGSDQELLSKDELIEKFSLERVNKAGARFDPDKAKWFNQQYLRAKSDEELAALAMPDLAAKGFAGDEAKLAKICGLLKERAVFVRDIVDQADFFISAPVEYDAKTVKKKWKENSANYLGELKLSLSELITFDSESCENVFKTCMEKLEIGFGQLGPAFRLALTGQGAGPSLFDICAILGKDEVLNRIDLAIEKLG